MRQPGARSPAAVPAATSAPRPLGATVGLGLLVVYLALAPLLFSTVTLGAFEFPKALLLNLAALLFVALGLCAALRPRATEASGRGWRAGLCGLWRRPLLLGVLLFLLSAVASTVASISPLTALLGVHESHAGLTTLASYAVLFFVARGLCRGYQDARRVVSACVLAAAVAAAYALLQCAGADPVAWSGRSGVGAYLRPFGTLGHPNFLAAYLVMALPLTLYLTRRAAADGRWLSCGVLALIALACCTAVVLSVSRAAWLALACVGVVLLAGAVRARRWRTVALTGGLPAAAVALLLGGAYLAGDGTLLQAVRQRVAGLTDSASRQHIWQAGLAIFRDYPLLGSGPDTFQLAFGGKRTAAYCQAEWDLTPARAHNEAIHVLATQGLVGVAALLTLLAGLGLAAVRAWRRAPAEARPLVLALAAAVVGFLVQGAFGFTVVGCGELFVTLAGLLSRLGEGAVSDDAPAPPGWWLPFGLTTAALLAGAVFALNFAGEENATAAVVAVGGATLGVVMLLSLGAVFRAAEGRATDPRCATAARVRPRPGPRSVVWQRSAVAAVWAATAVVGVYGVGCPLQANVLCCTGERLLADRPREAVQALACAVLVDPTKELHWTKLAAVAEAAAARVALPQERRELFQLARAALERAGRLSPRNAYHHANLGKVLGKMARAGLARADEVYAAFDRALALDGQNVPFYADAAYAALGLEDVSQARAYAARGTAILPSYAPTRAYLGYLALREGRFAEATTLLCEANAGAWHDRQPEQALALANLGTAYLRLRLFEHSASASRKALALAPRLAEAHCNLGVALEMLGQPEQAAEAYLQTLACAPGHAKARAGLDRLGARLVATE